MIRRSLAIALGAALLSFAAVAQEEEMELDQVLAAHYDAIGGKEAWEAVDAMQFSGKITLGPGMEAPTTMTIQRPANMRLEFTMQGMTGIQAYDGETAWQIMPFMGSDKPQKMNEDQAKSFAEQADLDGPLMNWEEKGHQVELMGKADVEGTETYKLKVTLDTGDVRYHYLDSEYFATIRTEGKTTARGQELEIETTLSDYKEVEGLMIPHSISSSPKGSDQAQAITIDSVVLNPEIEDGMFTMPVVEADESETEE